ncbi:MAG: S8 family serine peptidase [Thermoplasmata archaeon]|nr:MAG: S8 family serine peptidase [Thermoplasmata archaeon]
MDDVEIRILEYLSSKKEATIQEIAFALGVDSSTTEYYLKYLEESGEVKELMDKDRKFFRIIKETVGAKGEDETICQYCGTYATYEDLFCPSCGVKLKKKKATSKKQEEIEEISLTSVDQKGKKRVKTGFIFGVINGKKGKEPGLSKGPKREKRGLINGITNGLSNGLGTLRSGITNGITNGNGIVNGLGSRQIPFDKKRVTLRILGAFLFLILLLISPRLLSEIIVPEDKINIDGDFSDWKEVAPYSDEIEAPLFNSNVDIIDFGLVDSQRELSFYVKVGGLIFQGEPEESGRRMDTAYVFIDTDCSFKSGYQIEGIGSDFMVKLEGWKGEMFSWGLYKYTSNTQNWDHWQWIDWISAAAFGSELEVQVDYGSLGLKNHDNVDVLFCMQGYDGSEDFSDTVISNEKGVLIVTQQGVGDGYISGDANRLLKLDLKAEFADIIITTIKLTRTGAGNDGDLNALKLMDGNSAIATGFLKEGIAEFKTSILLDDGDSKTLYVDVDVGTNARAEGSIGFKVVNLHDVTTNKGAITVRTTPPNQNKYEINYIKSVPQGIKIDGAFADWNNIFSEAKFQETFNYFDSVCRSQLDSETEPVKNKNVDLTESRIVMDKEDVSFYFSVQENMMAGTRIPAVSLNAPRQSSPEPGKIEKPPIDVEDPHEDQEPQPPIEEFPIEPELIGEDTACIFLDTDDDVNTGFRVSCGDGGIASSFGADWMIKITGKYGLLRSSDYYRFIGLRAIDWDWEYQDTVPSKNDATQLETQIKYSMIGFDGNTGLGICIYVHDWDKGSEDYSEDQMGVRGGRSTTNQGNWEYNSQLNLRLLAGTFDPLNEELDVDSKLVTNTPNGYYIVQFKGPIQRSWKDEIRAMGGKFYGYIPEYAFIVGIDDAKIEKIINLSFVRWVGIYQPAYKAQKELLTSEVYNISLDILLFENNPEVTSEIENMGGEIESKSPSKLTVHINSTRIKDILFIPDVEWVEKTPQFKLSNNVSDDFERLNVNTVWQTPYNLNGSGQILGVCDSGLDTGENDTTMHDDFEGRIVKIYDLVGGGGETAADKNSGHGTHVAGSVLGNGAMSSGEIKGMAYGAQLVFQAVEDDQTGLITGLPSDLNTLFSQAYNDSARVHTNSWGSDVDGQYTSYSQDVDEFTWAHRDMVILFSAGNEGTDANSDGIVDLDSLHSPGTAKNCITVGASENYRLSGGYEMSYGSAWPTDFPEDPLNSDLMSNNSDGMVAFSSRGASNDGRIKPDLVAPGTNVLSTRSSVATGTLWGVYNAYYVYSGGTSMSTPLIAGCAALVRQYYIEVRGHTSPQGALIKATLINGAFDIPGQYGGSHNEAGPIPNFNEGWGRVNVTESIYPTSPRSMVYEDVTTGFTSSGQTDTYTYPVVAGEPLKITLVWTDYPGTPTSGGLVNDLNLNVSAPDGTTFYYGNDFTNGWSDESHTFDDTNNVECVYIQSPQSGTYTVSVMAENIAELGSESDQDYALVISGNLQFEDDVGIETLNVNKTQLKDTQAEIKAKVKNFGSNNQTNPFDVRCVITNPEKTEVLNDTQTVSSLSSLNTINLTWHYTPPLYGQYTVFVRTELSADDYNDNNASTKYMMVPLELNKLVTMTGTDSNDLFGFNVTSGHLNNDNYQDLIVGAPGANRAYVFYGSSSLSGNLNAASADVILIGPDSNSRFGWAVGVSDVTGDGFDDVIVGAPAYSSDQGRVYIYHSSSTGLGDTIADVNITGGGTQDRFGNSVSGAGDFNGANNEDVIIGAYLNDSSTGGRSDAGMAYVFFGTQDLKGNLDITSAGLNLTGKSEGDYFGFSVSYAGNVNDDAYDDIIIGAAGASKVYLYYGWEGIGEGGEFTILFQDGFESGGFIDGGWTLSSPPPVVTTDRPRTGSYAAGGSVAIFGPNLNTYSFQKNIDTTRYENVAVAYYIVVTDAGPGTISFTASYSTDGGGIWIEFEPPITNTNNLYEPKFWDLSAVPDVNDNPNFAIKFAGTFGGMAQNPANGFWVDDVVVTATSIHGVADPNVTLIGENADDNFGWSVSSAGNVDGDSYDDVVIGAPDYNLAQGRAYVFYGADNLSESISASDANVTLNGGNIGDKFGYSVGSTDLGGDSYSDILVGAPYNDTIDGSKTDAGAIYIFNGSSMMPDIIDTGNCTRYGENANDHFGWSVFNAEDVNGDNYGDIIVGAPHYDDVAATDAGKAYVLTIIPEYPSIMAPIIGFILAFGTLKGRLRIKWRRR